METSAAPAETVGSSPGLTPRLLIDRGGREDIARRLIRVVDPAMKSQKSSTIARCSSCVTRPTQGAEHLLM